MTQFLKPIHLACGTDDLRPSMHLVEIKNGCAIATNAEILIKLKITGLTDKDLENIEGKYIHRKVWKEIFKCDNLIFKPEEIVCFKNGIDYTFRYYDISNTGMKFPITERIIKDAAEKQEVEMSVISLSAKYIEIISKVFGDKGLSFFLGGKGNAICVYPAYNDNYDAMAILMPINANKENLRKTFY